jgi:hypothetical protein
VVLFGLRVTDLNLVPISQATVLEELEVLLKEEQEEKRRSQDWSRRRRWGSGATAGVGWIA